MSNAFLIVGLLIGPVAPTAAPEHSCAREVGATLAAYRLSDLPTAIRADLNLIARSQIGDRGSPLLETDAPTREQANLPTSRFYQALQVNGEWFVQLEVAMFAGVRTIGYVPDENGGFRRYPLHYFGGPACKSIKAALRGVTTPGGFNF